MRDRDHGEGAAPGRGQDPPRAASVAEATRPFSSGCFIRDIADNIVAAAEAPPIEGYVAYSPAGSEAAFAPLLPDGVRFLPSRRLGLGDSLLDAAADLLAAGYGAACLVNSDSPTLPTALLVEAARALAMPGDRVVLGPAEDGGYYLIGLKQPHRRLFEDIAWSTELVFAQTLDRAAEIGLDAVTLPVLVRRRRRRLAAATRWPTSPVPRRQELVIRRPSPRFSATVSFPAAGALSFETDAATPIGGACDEFAFLVVLICGGLLLLLTGIGLYAQQRGSDRRRSSPSRCLQGAVMLGGGVAGVAWKRVALATVAAVLAVAAADAPRRSCSRRPICRSDIYRYVWDGRVAAAGINPYRYIPTDPQLETLARSRDLSRDQSQQLRADDLSAGRRGDLS